jgi:hypothetical protein
MITLDFPNHAYWSLSSLDAYLILGSSVLVIIALALFARKRPPTFPVIQDREP